ncbi:hypothetical protein DdX_01161 [Ditylenchus destructor]|uniref:Uncharacterized protein n=1 Tax=Ditylenchus destructor TaxID=166010 RepID=A0AAD4NGF8_9BILA|nr:hypothetical protein DdX_01161 [Ditylenchus destructor]
MEQNCANTNSLNGQETHREQIQHSLKNLDEFSEFRSRAEFYAKKNFGIRDVPVSLNKNTNEYLEEARLKFKVYEDDDAVLAVERHCVKNIPQ